MWTLKTVLSHQKVKEKNMGEIIKYMEINDNENKTYQNVWGIAKSMLRRKLIVVKKNCIEKNQKQNQSIT